jgi:hypothetical protein
MYDTELAKLMEARADADKLSPDHDMRIKAAAFEEAAHGFWKEPQTHDVKQFLGCWARARGAWCDYVGENLAEGLLAPPPPGSEG